MNKISRFAIYLLDFLSNAKKIETIWAGGLGANRANNKASAESLTTVILIVLAVASVGLAGYSVMNLVNSANIQSSPTYNCLDLQSKITPPVQITKACVNADNEIEVFVKRSSENLNINSISFFIDAESWTCSESCASSCEVLQAGTSKKYFLTPAQNPQNKNLQIFLGSCLIDEAKIANC